MTTSGRRIAIVLAALLGAFAVVVGAFADLMIGDHGIWLERSYRNRWAFRDVPTRRGSILDRNGVTLVTDVADFSLELDYRTFRREHLAGMVISAASLLDPGAYAYAGEPAGADAALRRLLALPVAKLHGDVSPRELARDLRFYVYGFGAELLGVSRQEMVRRLLPAIRAQSTAPLASVMGLDVDRAVEMQRARVHDLFALDARLGAGALIRRLDRFRVAHAERPEVDPYPVAVARGLTYDAVTELAAFAELWPGLRARPTVERQEPGARERWPSLLSLFGETTAMMAVENSVQRDADSIARSVGGVVSDADLATYFPEADGLDDDAAKRLESRARSFVRRRLEVDGRAGRSGVEAAADEILAGQPGLRWVERDARAREQLLYRSLDVAPGIDVHLTIDVRLQELLEQELDEHARGLDTAMVVLDARTGDILALGGRPLELATADGPRLRRVSPAATWRSTGYVGSLAKPFVLLEQLAAEREGRPHVSRADLTACAGAYRKIAGTNHMLSCDHVHGTAATDPVFALGHSCNIFFFQLSEGLGMDGLRRAYERAGWTDLEEVARPGFYQRRVAGVSGMAASSLAGSNHVLPQMGIGYGLQACTVMVARAYAALATGMLPTVGLVQELARPAPLPLGATVSELELVRAGLRACVQSGTAADVSGLVELGVYGKTGTAEVGDEKPRKNNAWFAGFVLAANARPTLAFAAVAYVVDDHGKDSAGMVRGFLRGILAHQDVDLRRRWLDGIEER